MKKYIFYKIIGICVIFSIFCYGCSSNNVNLVKFVNVKTINFAELNSDLSTLSNYEQHFRNGVNLALNEINATGGVNGKKIVITHYNDYLDYFKSKETIYKLNNSNTIATFGTFFSQPSIGAASGAQKFGIPFLSSAYTDANIYKDPNDYTYSLRPDLKSMLKSLALYANKVGNLNRWLIITYSDAESREAAKFFENTLINLSKLSSNSVKQNFMFNYVYTSQFKVNQYINSKSIKNYLNLSKAALIITNGRDLQSLIDKQGFKELLSNKIVFAPFAGDPEWLQYTSNVLTPEKNWIVTGYPWYAKISNEHNIFYRKYYNAYSLQPRYSSLLGYLSVYILANAAAKTNFNSNNIVQIREDFNKELSKTVLRNSPLGSISFRDDHISTIGVFSGILNIYSEIVISRNGTRMTMKDVRMRDISYLKGSQVSSCSEEDGVNIRTNNMKKNNKLKKKFLNLNNKRTRKIN